MKKQMTLKESINKHEKKKETFLKWYHSKPKGYHAERMRKYREKKILTDEEKEALKENQKKWYYSKPKEYHAERMRQYRVKKKLEQNNT